MVEQIASSRTSCIQKTSTGDEQDNFDIDISTGASEVTDDGQSGLPKGVSEVRLQAGIEDGTSEEFA